MLMWILFTEVGRNVTKNIRTCVLYKRMSGIKYKFQISGGMDIGSQTWGSYSFTNKR